MKKVLIFGASTSLTSINQQLAVHTATLLENLDTTIIDLNDFEMPIYSVDREENGFPEEAENFVTLIKEHDGIIISLAEHNGTYTAAFKNILDWSSRIKAGKLWQKTPMLVLSTSPGARGGATVINLALSHWPFMDANIVSNFSLPMFNKNFIEEKGIVDDELNKQLNEAVKKFQTAVA